VSETNPLVEQVLAGESFELRVLAAQGILPLSPAELIPLQVALAESDDPYLSATAQASLSGIDARVAAVYLASEAPDEVQRWFALYHDDSYLIEAILRRRDVQRELLHQIAPRLSTDLQEALLLRQDAILDAPKILDALERNPMLSPFSRRRIAEYREHLLPRAAAPAAVALPSQAFFLDEDEFTDDELEQISFALKKPAGGDTDRRTGLSEHQIRTLAVPLRLKLARGASRTLRQILVKDVNTNVALMALSQSAFSEEEVEQLAASRAVIDDVLVAIAKKREWVSRYGVCLNLVRNPLLPVGIAMRLLPKLGVRDLRNLSTDRNIPNAVRSAAQRLYRIKAV